MRQKRCFVPSVLLCSVLCVPIAFSQDDIFGGTDSGDSFGLAAPGDQIPNLDDTQELPEFAGGGTRSLDLNVDETHSARPDVSYRPRRQSKVITETIYELIPDSELKLQRQWKLLRQKVLDQNDPAKRESQASELEKLLTTIFDDDLQKRETEVAKLEARVKKLRNAVENRKTNRDRIIKNRIESLLLKAEGLTLPGTGNQSALNSDDKRENERRIESFTVQKRGRDGSADVRVVYTAFNRETRTRMVPRTVFTRRKGTNTAIPVTKQVQETYNVYVPEQREVRISVPPNVNVSDYVKQVVQGGETAAGNWSRLPEDGGGLDDIFENSPIEAPKTPEGGLFDGDNSPLLDDSSS